MDKGKTKPGDSLDYDLGTIPGTAGLPAFSVSRNTPSPIPVLIAVPHAGRTYPKPLLAAMRNPVKSGIRLEDRLADLLAEQVARETGAGLIVAHAARAMIDLNRAPEDMDWDMVSDGRPAGFAALRVGSRTRGGLGLVPRRLHGIGEIWKGKIDRAELDARIEGVHVPYHVALANELAAIKERWGSALLIDFHSMPPLGPHRNAPGFAEYVVGDRFGSSCSGAISAAVFDHLAAARKRAAHNRPYAGGYALDRHTAPTLGIHGMQMEVCRGAYLNEDMRELGANFAEVADLLSALVRRLADEMAALRLPLAAE